MFYVWPVGSHHVPALLNSRRVIFQLMDTFYEILTLTLNRPVIFMAIYLIVCLWVTLLYDFMFLNTKLLNSLRLECADKLKHCLCKKIDFFKKRTLVVILLR